MLRFEHARLPSRRRRRFDQSHQTPIPNTTEPMFTVVIIRPSTDTKLVLDNCPGKDWDDAACKILLDNEGWAIALD